MCSDILNGVFPPGADLPSAKELQSRYGASWAPVKKALEHLRFDGILEARNRGYGVPAFHTPAFRSRIVLLAHTYDSFVMALSQHDEEIFKTLERYCQNANIVLDVFLLYWGGLDSPPKDRHVMRERRTGKVFEVNHLAKTGDPVVLGFVLVVPGEFAGLEEILFRIFAAAGKPVAIIDELGTNTLPRVYASSRRMRAFPVTAASESAEIVGRYLVSLGHQRIAFVSPYHQFPWSQRRLEGLLSVSRSLGDCLDVKAFIEEDDPMAGIAPAELVAFYASLRTRLPEAERVEYDQLMARVHEGTAREARTRTVVYTLMDRLLPDIRAGRSTALVAVNDQVAVMMLAYLSAYKIGVPAEVSVISFDDTREAPQHNLTSFNFNATATATAMLGHILGLRPFMPVESRPADEIVGYLVERQTTARV